MSYRMLNHWKMPISPPHFHFISFPLQMHQGIMESADWQPGQLWTTSCKNRSQSIQKCRWQCPHSYRLLALMPLLFDAAASGSHSAASGIAGNARSQEKHRCDFSPASDARFHDTSWKFFNGNKWWYERARWVDRISVRPHAGHSAGRLQTLLPQREHK